MPVVTKPIPVAIPIAQNCGWKSEIVPQLSTPQIQSNTLLYIIYNSPIETVINWDIQPNLAGYIP